MDEVDDDEEIMFDLMLDVDVVDNEILDELQQHILATLDEVDDELEVLDKKQQVANDEIDDMVDKVV